MHGRFKSPAHRSLALSRLLVQVFCLIVQAFLLPIFHIDITSFFAATELAIFSVMICTWDILKPFEQLSEELFRYLFAMLALPYSGKPKD